MAINVEDYYRRFGAQVLRRCRFLLRNEEQAVDALHDVFVQLLRHRQGLRHQGPSSLLHCIATRICLNRLRTASRTPVSPLDERLLQIACAQDPEAQIGARRLLATLFESQSVRAREIAVYHLVDGMTLEETAREVGLSVSGVRKRLRTLSTALSALEAA
jgi:RNA polymerase sigma-70 factor (ECF subfamily)